MATRGRSAVRSRLERRGEHHLIRLTPRTGFTGAGKTPDLVLVVQTAGGCRIILSFMMGVVRKTRMFVVERLPTAMRAVSF